MEKSEETTVSEQLHVISEEIENNVTETKKETPKKGRPPQKPQEGKYRTDEVDAKTKRVLIGTKDILKFPQRPGFVRRIVNDVDDRIKRFEAAGWRVVQETKEGGDTRVGAASQLASPVLRPVGGGTNAVLMELPEELYKEDQLKKQKIVDLSEESINRTGTTNPNRPVNAQYGEVKIG